MAETPRLSWTLARLRLLRLSNFPSPLADVAAGAAMGRLAAEVGGGGAVPPVDYLRIALASIASLTIYHAGMALNDYADRLEDSISRPDRPIPSSAVSPGGALAIGTALTAASAMASIAAENHRIVLPLIAIVYIYNFLVPRGALAGPLLLGGARALNVLSGAAIFLPAGVFAAGVGGGFNNITVLAVAGGYGAYVCAVSIFAVQEDRPFTIGRTAASFLLAIASATWVGACFEYYTFPNRNVSALLWLPFLEPLAIILGPRRPWNHDRVGQLVGAGLRATITFQAVICYACGTPAGSALCAGGYITSRWLARAIPPN